MSGEYSKKENKNEEKSKMELAAEEIVKLLKGFKIAEANTILDNARSYIEWNTEVK